MHPYVSGRPISEVKRLYGLKDIVKLASNENPLGPSPKAVLAMQEAATEAHRYPDTQSWQLKEALADKFGVPSSQVMLGAGSDELIGMLGQIYVGPGDEAVFGDPSFLRYDAAVELADAQIVKVPLTKDWVHDLDAMKAAVTDRTRLMYFGNPNNPTGTIVGKSDLRAFLEQIPDTVTVVLDEAYFEFASVDPDYPDGLELLKEGWNVVVLRTFSKAYGLAGLRIGYGFASTDVVDAYNAARSPFDINVIAQAGAVAALEDTGHMEKTVSLNSEQMRRLENFMAETGFSVVPSHANFACVNLRQSGVEVWEELLKNGVIVRPGEQLGMAQHLRVSLGTGSEMDSFFEAFSKVMSSKVTGVAR